MWYKKKVVMPGGKETIQEIITEDDGIGFGVAVATIKESKPHRHEVTAETYTLISGILGIFIGNMIRVLDTPGQSVTIPPNTRHFAKITCGKPARVLVVSIPAWTQKDHIDDP